MRIRKGFVSNSSSTSFVLVLPTSGKISRDEIRSHFSLDPTSKELEEAIMNVIETNDTTVLSLMLKEFEESIEFMESCLDDPSFAGLRDFYIDETRQEKRILELYKESPERLRAFEVGNSISYVGFWYFGGLEETDLKRTIQKNCFMIDNH